MVVLNHRRQHLKNNSSLKKKEYKDLDFSFEGYEDKVVYYNYIKNYDCTFMKDSKHFNDLFASNNDDVVSNKMGEVVQTYEKVNKGELQELEQNKKISYILGRDSFELMEKEKYPLSDFRDKDLLNILNTLWGYETFRPNQKELMEKLLKSENCMALLPTSGGKSLIYQIPAIILDGGAIIISPLVSLMDEQASSINNIFIKNKLDLRAEVLNGEREKQEDILKRFKEGRVPLLYMAPEKFIDTKFLDRIESLPISFLAFDESHCLSDWGNSFREKYLYAGAYAKLFQDIPKIALTATATSDMVKDIQERIGIYPVEPVRSSFNRTNLFYEIRHMPETFKDLDLMNEAKNIIFQRHHLYGKEVGVIYCGRKKTVMETVDFLREQGINARPYHADLTKEEKDEHLAYFMNPDNKDAVIVATIAFGMGIDKSNVRYVIHINIPKSIEAYYQEAGRGGRDGQEAFSYILLTEKQIFQLKGNIERSDDLTMKGKRMARKHYITLASVLFSPKCRRKTTLKYFEENDYHVENCGMCDRCTNAKNDTFDATEYTYKFIKLVEIMNKRNIFPSVTVVSHAICGNHKGILSYMDMDDNDFFGFGWEISNNPKWWEILGYQIFAENFFLLNDSGGLILKQNSGRNFIKNYEKNKHHSIYLIEPQTPKILPGVQRIKKPLNIKSTNAELIISLTLNERNLLKRLENLAFKIYGKDANECFNDLLILMRKKPKNNKDFINCKLQKIKNIHMDSFISTLKAGL